MSLTNSLVRHQIFLERYAGTLAKLMQTGIEVARNDVLVELTTKKLDQISPVAIQEIIRRKLIDNMNLVMSQLELLAVQEKDFNKRVVERYIKDFINDVSDEDLIDALVDNNMNVGLADKTQNRNILVAYDRFAEKNATTLVQPIKDAQVLGGDPLSSADTITALAAGLLAVQARSLSRASVVHASNTSKDTLFRANAQIIQEVEWVSVLDSRTTDFCRNQNKKRYKVGEGPRPPAHYNCRSITKPVINNEK